MMTGPIEVKSESDRVANLIERLEKAVGPDRAYDDAIMEALGGRLIQGATGTHPQWVLPNVEGCGVAPSFTASIDAALRLVPEGLEWVTNNRGMKRKPGFTEWNGWAGIYGEPFVGSENDSYGATPAIALCIAALKARAALPSGSRGRE